MKCSCEKLFSRPDKNKKGQTFCKGMYKDLDIAILHHTSCGEQVHSSSMAGFHNADSYKRKI